MDALVPDDVVSRLNQLQQTLLKKQLPVLIVLEGSSGRVIGRVSNELMRCLEPIGVRYNHFDPADGGDSRFIFGFLRNTPGNGQIGIYDRSWYSFMIEKFNEDEKKKELDRMLDLSNDVERYLVQNGILLIKIFLKASESALKEYGSQYWPSEPRRSFLSMDHIDPAKFREVMLEHVYEKTDTEYAGWNKIEIGALEDTVLGTIETVIGSIERRLESKPKFPHSNIERPYPNPRNGDYGEKCDSYEDALKEVSERLQRLQMDLSLSDRSLVVCFEGWDAAGKGSCIKHLCHALNPRGYEVFQTKAPNEEELSHTYLWRFSKGIPMKGHITIYDRTWYGRMMVEHIERLCTDEEYGRSPSEINSMERMMTENGTILLKFWLEITPEEQLKRFKKRAGDPLKKWKITKEDWRNRDKWDDYDSHVDVMMESTNTEHAPWTVIEANEKKYARVSVLNAVADALERELKK
ncbi:MAG: hypothetical protein LBR42_05080 [Candidatus Methanoplasma sp.]|jgi:polyphosphate kinase 2 (PPK2 family)|nr:hypothetical protein [Candidatus Methanoplasma sp.]